MRNNVIQWSTRLCVIEAAVIFWIVRPMENECNGQPSLEDMSNYGSLVRELWELCRILEVARITNPMAIDILLFLSWLWECHLVKRAQIRIPGEYHSLTAATFAMLFRAHGVITMVLGMLAGWTGIGWHALTIFSSEKTMFSRRDAEKSGKTGLDSDWASW